MGNDIFSSVTNNNKSSAFLTFRLFFPLRFQLNTICFLFVNRQCHDTCWNIDYLAVHVMSKF